MKKFISIIICTILIMTGLSGCAKQKMPSPENPVTLTMWHVYGNQTTSPLNTVIDEFNRTVGKENGITIIHITHNMSEAINADRVIVVNDGRICMNDKPKAVFSNVSKLHQIGLDVPQVTELFYELKKDGIHLPTDIIDIDEGVEALASLLK